jgi:hypothetical protein
MEKVIASGPSNDDISKHVFLVIWKEYTHEENTCEDFDNIMENAEELLKEYYDENPNVAKDKRFGERKERRKDRKSLRKKKSRKRKED